MNDTHYRTRISRRFLLADLPEPLTRASRHLQLFDNYLENTRIRLRAVRDPHTKEWTRILEQRFSIPESAESIWKISEIFLNDAEYQHFERFEGREIRKNRYLHEASGANFEIDVYLGNLWGLCVAQVYFENIEEMRDFEMPDFIVAEITNYEFFNDANLVDKKFADVQEEYSRRIQTFES